MLRNSWNMAKAVVSQTAARLLLKPCRWEGKAPPSLGRQSLYAKTHKEVLEKARAGVATIPEVPKVKGTDIPVWVWSTYQHADWIALACSRAYHESVERLLRTPFNDKARSADVRASLAWKEKTREQLQ